MSKTTSSPKASKPHSQGDPFDPFVDAIADRVLKKLPSLKSADDFLPHNKLGLPTRKALACIHAGELIRRAVGEDATPLELALALFDGRVFEVGPLEVWGHGEPERVRVRGELYAWPDETRDEAPRAPRPPWDSSRRHFGCAEEDRAFGGLTNFNCCNLTTVTCWQHYAACPTQPRPHRPAVS